MKNLLKRNNKYYLCFIFSFITFLGLLFYIWKFTADDAYISFRYALHLSQGYGLVWNIGQQPIEGYTNFLWVLISSVLIFLKLDPALFTKFIGLTSIIGIILIYWKLAKDIFQNKKLYIAAFCISTSFLLINPATAIHIVSGLETMFYSALILLNAYLAYRLILLFNRRLFFNFSIISLILGLVRPEGILISLGLFILIYIMTLNKNRDIKNKIIQILPFIMVFIVPISLYIIFRILYFNEFFPLPFLVKSMSNGGLFNGIDALGSAIKYTAPFGIIILIYITTNLDSILKNKENPPKFTVLLITMAVATFFANIMYIFSSLYMNYAQRFYYPSFVMIYIAVGISLVLLINELKNKQLNKKLYNKYTKIFGFFIILLLLSSNLNFVLDFEDLHESGNGFSSSYIALGNELSAFSYDNLTFASVDAGSLPYFSRWNHIDMMGLNNKFIAKNGVATYDYIEKNHPDLIILISADGKEIINSKEQLPFIEFVEKNKYVRLSPIKYTNNYYLIAFLDPNIKDFDKIKQSIEKVSASSLSKSIS